MERLAGVPLKGCKGSDFVPMVEVSPAPIDGAGGAAWYYGGWLRLYDGASSQVAVHRPLAFWSKHGLSLPIPRAGWAPHSPVRSLRTIWPSE